MKNLYELTKELEISADTRKISGLVYDSRKICEGCLYIAIKGAKFDGHSAIAEAAAKGAAAVLAEYADDEQKKACEEAGCALYIVKDSRYALALCSKEYFDRPSEKLKTIGITGTKGKSTTAFMVRSAMEELGWRCGLIGTVETDTGLRHIPSVNTTPESYTLQSYLKEMVDAGLDCVVMEVSSQGLMMNRTAGICFDVGVFTNFSPDHIGPGEHKDIDDYLHCKSLLFKSCKTAVVNDDDEKCGDILKDSTCEKVIRYGFNERADVRAVSFEPSFEAGALGSKLGFVADEERYEMLLPYPGRFSAYNILSALTAVCALRNSFDKQDMLKIEKGLGKALIKGRMELLPVAEDHAVMIDYAHNAMALESLLKALREYCRGSLITLFGCGGNRAKSRRYEMGEASGRLSDLTVITSDNPRDEEPMDIIADIEEGIARTNGKHVTIADRKQAIAYAMHEAKAGDIVILAGKGHEDYQEIKGVKHHMDERELVYEILKEDNDSAAISRMLKRYPYLADK